MDSAHLNKGFIWGAVKKKVGQVFLGDEKMTKYQTEKKKKCEYN